MRAPRGAFGFEGLPVGSMGSLGGLGGPVGEVVQYSGSRGAPPEDAMLYLLGFCPTWFKLDTEPPQSADLGVMGTLYS